MIKNYLTSEAEKIQFCYNQQAVASGGGCFKSGEEYSHAEIGCESEELDYDK